MPRRKPGELLPLEQHILRTALSMRKSGELVFHGFRLARTMSDDHRDGLIAHGTLYKALGRLEDMGMLTSQWESEPPEGRPRRRLYELTGRGVAAASAATPPLAQRPATPRLSPGTA